VVPVRIIALALAAVFAFAAPAAAAPPVAHWTFNEGTGATAADSADSHPATLLGGAGWTAGIQGPFALDVNGSGQYADAGGPVIDTAHSFSVSAWVKLDRLTGYQTFVSVDGSQVSGFYFQFRDDTRRFAFVKLPGDAPAGAPAFPSANFDPVAGQWYLLTGVFDAAAQTLSLYVNGRLQDTTPAPTTWTAPGHMVIGRGRFGGNNVDYVDGAIDDVRVYDEPLTAADVEQLAVAGFWRFEEGTGTAAADDSLNARTGTLTGDASWTTGIVGRRAVQLDGSSGFVDVPDPVIDTSQSFSVAAWVKPSSVTGFRSAVSVDGSQVSGFFLQQRDDGRFAFTKLASDAPGPGTFAASSATARAGQWYHLVGVYDRVANTLTLYVNGTRQETVTAPAAWRAGGHFVIGRGKYGGAPVDFYAGAIDDVRAYPFAMDSASAAALATSGLWHFDEGAGTVAHDSSPNRADGTLRNASWVAGAAGKAVAFDGDGDVTMGDVPGLNLGTGAASVSAWFRTLSNARQSIVRKGDGYELAVDGGHMTAQIGTISVSATSGGLADGLFHHAAVTLDRTSQRLVLYVDGEPAPIAPTTGSCGTPAGTTALDVSACESASGDSSESFTVGSGLSGAADEVQVVHFALTGGQVAAMAGFNTLDVDAASPRTHIPSTMYGAILEDISHSVEGGLYAELVRNRSFKDDGTSHWTLVTGGGAEGSFSVDTTQPLNSAIDRSLKIHVASLPAGARVAASNDGFYGIAVAPDTVYRGQLFAKATPGFSGRLVASLEKPDGTVLTSRSLGAVGADWTHETYTLRTPSGIARSTNNRVVISVEGNRAISNQDVWLSTVSLFPPTSRTARTGCGPTSRRSSPQCTSGCSGSPAATTSRAPPTPRASTGRRRSGRSGSARAIRTRRGATGPATAWGCSSTCRWRRTSAPSRCSRCSPATPSTASTCRRTRMTPRSRARWTRSSTRSATPRRRGEPGALPTGTPRRSMSTTSRSATRTGSTGPAPTRGGSRACTTPSRRATRS
jgi:hypothetical protein